MKKKCMFLIALCIVSLVTFSNAAYAWFSKQYNPKVDDLSFNIATQEYMMISTTGEPGSFKDEINFHDLIGENQVVLRPVRGVVSENHITLYKGNDVAEERFNYIKFTLYFSGSNDMDIYLAGSISGTVIDIIKVENSIFTEEQISKFVDSLRIGFLAYSTRETPTSSGLEVSYDPVFTHVYSLNEKTDASYESGLKPYETFNSIGYTEREDDVVLLGVDANKVSKMDVYIWLEDEDVNCNESIFNSRLQVNLRFLAVKNEEGDNDSN